MIKNILSIDVEEIFHAEYTRQYVGRNKVYRTPYNIPSVLGLLKKHNVKATFFVVGELAERYPAVLRMIIEEGHEVAFHGWTHRPLWDLSTSSLTEEMRTFRRIYSDCKGYRAPSFSLDNKTKWALEVLHREGFHYDSSIFPMRTTLYGLYNSPIRPYKPSLEDLRKEDGNGSIIEFPLSVYCVSGLRIPISGGFWLRLWNLGLMNSWVRKINGKNIPVVIFVHSWEIDQDVEKLNLPFFNRFVTYHGITGLKEKFLALIKSSAFTNFELFLEENS